MKNSEPERLARGLDLSNPAFVFAFVWLLALVLTTLRWTTQLIGIPQSLRWLILGNIATITLWYIGFSALNSGFQRRLSGLPTAAELHQLEGFARVVGWFAIAGSLFEVIVGRGVPLQWLLVGDTTRDYRDFGIPTFHGLVTSAYMFYTTTRIVLFAATGRRMAIWHGVLLLAWPLVIINRAGLDRKSVV